MFLFNAGVGVCAAVGILVIGLLIINAINERYDEWKKERRYVFEMYQPVCTKYNGRKIIGKVIDRQITENKKRLYRITPCVDIYDTDFINEVQKDWINGWDIWKPLWR